MREFIERINRGDTVYLYEVERAFEKEKKRVWLTLKLCGGGVKSFELGYPVPKNDEELEFLRSCVYARVYNILSMFGGVSMNIKADESLRPLFEHLSEVFGAGLCYIERTGYAKCLNVTDRINRALGEPHFSFDFTGKLISRPDSAKKSEKVCFKAAVQKAGNALICGMDIGGSDIKIIGSKYGKLDHIKEYDWNPAAFKSVDDIISTLCVMVRLSRALLSIDGELSGELKALADDALSAQIPLGAIKASVERMEQIIGEIKPLDGIGISFPDVVVRDKIVGGETHKTKGVRDNSPDYEAELARLISLKEALMPYARQGAAIRLTNDGNMAAYTAAVELAHSDRAEDFDSGVFAHTLGTELGTGWVDENGLIPEYPLEVYNAIIDIGTRPAWIAPHDVRSSLNHNTRLPGTLQKYAGQNGAYRLAAKYYEQDAPALFVELMLKGYIGRDLYALVVPTEPVDMRKAFLEHLMNQAENGVEPARRIFISIGEYLAATWIEIEKILKPQTKSRILYGRFVKRKSCFDLMVQGARRILPDIELIAADDELACTPLMKQLNENGRYGVAQFGQAVGSVYFASGALS